MATAPTNTTSSTPQTSATAKPQGQAEILLESGTNELEVLIFSVGDNVFGVNVAKVREVILPVTVAASPGQPSCVNGMFNLRGKVLPLVDLHKYLTIEAKSKDPKDLRIIVTEFNGIRSGFLVDRVELIYRMSWSQMRPVPQASEHDSFAITGIAEIDGRLVLMLDFESILDHISMSDKLHVSHVENKLGVNRSLHRVFLAEDSKFIRNLMRNVLANSGYSQVTIFSDGAEAWKAIQAGLNAPELLPSVLVTDIEMPQMDGLALTKQVKQEPRSRHIPVVLFSSLVTDDTRHKGEQVGANQQIAKPQLPELVDIVDQWVKQIEDRTPTAPAPGKAA